MVGLAWGGSLAVKVVGSGLNGVKNSGGSRGFEEKERERRERERREKKKSVFRACSGF